MPNYEIEVDKLTKKFGNFTAVDNLSFSISRGEIFGFLGPNGAGKSTTIRMLCGLLQPTSGRGKVGGFDINEQSELIKQNIGYMSQRFSLYEDLTVEENIRFFGGVYGISNQKLKNRMDWVIKMAGLQGREKSLTKTLSGGWKQRLALGCAVLHEPKIIFLDEPTSGVDPISRRNFWELINKLSEDGITVLVTTHYLDEAEYCNKLALINNGRLIASGSPKDLKEEHINYHIYEVEVSDVITAMEVLGNQPWVVETSLFGTYIHIGVIEGSIGTDAIASFLNSNNLAVKRIAKITPSLEDVFFHLLEEDLKDRAA